MFVREEDEENFCERLEPIVYAKKDVAGGVLPPILIEDPNQQKRVHIYNTMHSLWTRTGHVLKTWESGCRMRTRTMRWSKRQAAADKLTAPSSAMVTVLKPSKTPLARLVASATTACRW